MPNPHIKCYLALDQSSHEGSGGGFSVVKFFHLVVENRTEIPLRAIRAPYRLMKREACLQEGVLTVEHIAPGATVRSKTFIRESPVFDRIDLAQHVIVEADQAIPPAWITFNRTIPGQSKTGCLIAAALLLLLAAGAAYFFLFRG